MIVTEHEPRLRTCPVCTSPVREDFIFSHVQTDLDILNELMRRHPSWVQPDGTCPQGLVELRASREASRKLTRA